MTFTHKKLTPSDCRTFKEKMGSMVTDSAENTERFPENFF